MFRLRHVWFVMAVLACGLVWAATARGQAAKEHDLLSAIDLKELGDGARWTKVTERPVAISSILNVLCEMPTQADYDRVRARNPHASTSINVYVNATGARAMASIGSFPFPPGSVIVKEKFHSDQGFTTPEQRPDLYTVMVKREPGYNPEVGDWEFAVVSGDDLTVKARGKIETCMTCHKQTKDRDYVFATYLQPESPR